MLIDIVNSENFANMMHKHIEDLLLYFFEQDQNFGILCRIEHLSFDPELPKSISDEFRPMTLFFLAGYTFESAQIEDNMLTFEAGFGAEDVGSFVSVPLLSIMQIIIDETPVFVNLAQPQKRDVAIGNNDQSNGIKNSMNALLSNPENRKFMKKK